MKAIWELKEKSNGELKVTIDGEEYTLKECRPCDLPHLSAFMKGLAEDKAAKAVLQGAATAAVGGAESGAGATPSAGSSSGLVNINTASAAELQTLSGIGPSMAQSIIDERTKNGAFASVDDLMRVSGIGEKKLAKIKDCICV